MPTELLQQMTAGWSEALVYIAIGLVTLVGFFKCIYPVFRNGSILGRAVMKLEKSTAQGKRAIWRDARFLGRSLQGDWQRFLLNAGQLDLRGMPCNADEYINEDTVIYKPGHAQLAELIPSLLTSLGILGTFLGLMEGLTSLDFSNAAGTIESIPSLLGGMRFAFATSVAGIACSLLFNMLNRIMVGRAFKALDTFDEAFYELAMPRPLDPDVQMICQKQDDEANLQLAAENVASHVAGALELAIGRAMHPLTISMDNFIKGATQEQIDGIQKIVGQFVRQMNASLDGQITALGDTMHMVNQGQLQTQQNLKRTLEVAEMLSSEARRIQEASHDIASRMRSISAEMDISQKERAASEAMAARAMEKTSGSLQEELESLTFSLARMKGAVDELTSQISGSLPRAEEVPAVTSLWEEDLAGVWQSGPSAVAPKGARKATLAAHSKRSPGLEA